MRLRVLLAVILPLSLLCVGLFAVLTARRTPLPAPRGHISTIVVNSDRAVTPSCPVYDLSPAYESGAAAGQRWTPVLAKIHEDTFWFWHGPEQLERKMLHTMLHALFEFPLASVREGCFLYAGTLLGAIRIHSILPWDDDADAVCHIDSRAPLLDNTRWFAKHGLRLVHWGETNLKVTALRQRSTTHKHAWEFPFIDIFFWTKNRDNRTVSLPRTRGSHFDGDDLLLDFFIPPRAHCFEGSLFPVPRQAEAVLDAYFQGATWRGECRRGNYDHLLEKSLDKTSGWKHPCRELAPVWPVMAHVLVP